MRPPRRRRPLACTEGRFYHLSFVTRSTLGLLVKPSHLRSMSATNYEKFVVSAYAFGETHLAAKDIALAKFRFQFRKRKEVEATTTALRRAR